MHETLHELAACMHDTFDKHRLSLKPSAPSYLALDMYTSTQGWRQA